MKTLVSYAVSTALVAASMGSAPAALADTPGELRDLIGIRGSSLDYSIGERGYFFTKNDSGASMYWNDGQKRCVSVRVYNGRVSSIDSASSSACGKGGGNGAAVAVGVVALAGLAALLASRGKDKNKNSDAAYSRAYDRGYDDGLNGRKHVRNQGESYDQGYLAGERYRGIPHTNHSKVYISGAPRNVQDACKRRADTFFGAVPGVSKPVSAFNYGRGNYEIVTSTHKIAGTCSVDSRGYVTDFRKKD